MFFDYYYIVLVLPAVLVALFAQMNVKSTFNRYNKVSNSRGFTGASVARQILDRNGLYHVPVERVSGQLSDHYDPKANVVRLSDATFNSTSVAALGVAAHEVGHAVQYSEKYSPIVVRNAIVPVCRIGSSLTMPLIILGLIVQWASLIYLGIALFGLATIFQLITLPVEFNASKRALRTLEEYHVLDGGELVGARKTLNAAALTYVAALAVSLMQLLRLLLLFGGRGRRR